MKKYFKVVINLTVFTVLVLPAVTFGAGLVLCGNKDQTACDWNGLMATINGLIHFVLFDMAVPIAAIMFAYAGFKMVTAGGESGEARNKAKSIFTNTLFGLIIAIAAWLIISTLLFILGYDASWIGLKVN